MKSYYVVLLVAGAGLAGGLAYKMTQLEPLPLPAPVRTVVSAPPPAPDVARVKKPSPIPQKTAVKPPVTAHAEAPETVYSEPPKPVVRRSQPAAPPTPVRKNEPNSVANVVRKNEPNLMANVKPKQWIPGKYDSPGDSRVVAKVSPSPAFAKPAPVVAASLDRTATTPVVPAIEKEAVAAPVPLHQATLQTGMTLAIRLSESLSSDFSRVGGTFAGTLIDPLIAGGFVIAERGARVTGRVLESQKAGRAAGASRLELGLTNVYTSDGQQVAVSTERWMRLGENIPADTVIRFRLISNVTITERQLASK